MKKLGRIPDGRGWRTLGLQAGRENKKKNTPVGHTLLHSTSMTTPGWCTQRSNHLDNARADILAFTSFPEGLWQQIWSNNPNERLNREIRRRPDSVGTFPNRDAIIRLVGAVLAEQTDEWAEGRRRLDLDILAKIRLTLVPDNGNETTEQTLALSA